MLFQSQNQRRMTCPKGHNLIQTNDLLNLYEKRRTTGDMYCCDICGEGFSAKITPTNHCIICNFNFCFACEQSQSPIEKSLSSIENSLCLIQINCPQNHPLLKASSLGTCSNYLENKYRCNSCQASFDSSIAPAAYCRICYYDLCPGCHTRAQYQVSMNSLPSLPQKTFLKSQGQKPQKTQNSKGESESKENGDNMLCVVCLTDQRNHSFVPCMHLCVCEGCSSQIKSKKSNCPICRGMIQSYVKVCMS